MQMARWRGFDNLFGDLWTNLDGIIIYSDKRSIRHVYTCQDASKYADTLNDSYVKVGEEVANDGAIKSFDLGDAAHIIPHVVGNDNTQYMCGYHWIGQYRLLRTFLVGGNNMYASICSSNSGYDASAT